MTLRDEIAALQARIAKAQSERDGWRGSGMQEKYLEAYSTVEALELELDALRQEGLRAFAREPSQSGAGPPSPGLAADHAGTPGERERLMAELSIAYDGRQYRYDRYLYDRLEDAVNYARLKRSAPAGSDAADPMPPAQHAEVPDEPQRAAMAALDISFRDGMYHLGDFRYTRLADAVSYARLLRTQGRQAPRG